MIYIGVFFCIAMATIAIITEKKIFNPLTVFGVLWMLILGLSSLRLFNLRVASEETYSIILSGICAYAVGYYLIRIFIGNKSFVLNTARYSNKEVIYLLRYKLLYILGGVCILFYLYDFSIVFSYLLKGNSLGYIRELAQDSNSVIYSSRSAIENAVRVLLVTPFVMALQPLVAVDFWIGKRDKKLIIINIIIITLRVVTDGSRVLIIYLLLHLLVAYQFTDSKHLKKATVISKKKVKQVMLILGISVMGGYALYKTTLSRSGENFVRYLYYYFSMEPYMFETWSNIVDSAGIKGYGLASINGFLFAFFYVVKNFLGLSNYPEYWYNIYSLIGATDSQWQVIAGDATIANAYVSIFWFLYLDGGVTGIIIGMSIYGMICAKTYLNAKNKKTAKSICVYSIILQGVCFSFVRLQFADIYYAIAVLFILIFAYKKVIIKQCKIQ